MRSDMDHTVLPANYTMPGPCLPLLPSRRTSNSNQIYFAINSVHNIRPLAGTHFFVPRRVEGWVDLGGWLHTEIKCRLRESNPDTVTHPSTNQAQVNFVDPDQRRYTTTPRRHQTPLYNVHIVPVSQMNPSTDRNRHFALPIAYSLDHAWKCHAKKPSSSEETVRIMRTDLYAFHCTCRLHGKDKKLNIGLDLGSSNLIMDPSVIRLASYLPIMMNDARYEEPYAVNSAY